MGAPILSTHRAGRWSTVGPAELQRARQRLVAFAEGMFESMPRADQRRRGETYLRGLLLDGRRKSIQPMAERLRATGEAEVGDLEQALQQFVNQSPWDPAPVRERLARRMTAELDPAAWVIDDTAFPKFGRWSVWPAGACARRWCWPMPATATPGSSGWAWTTASWAGWCRSRATPAPTSKTSCPSWPSTRVGAGDPSRATGSRAAP